jgi:hypothetical protein
MLVDGVLEGGSVWLEAQGLKRKKRAAAGFISVGETILEIGGDPVDHKWSDAFQGGAYTRVSVVVRGKDGKERAKVLVRGPIVCESDRPAAVKYKTDVKFLNPLHTLDVTYQIYISIRCLVLDVGC